MHGTLGKPYRIFYQSKENGSGLLNIQALVKKPNGTMLGPFTLIEETNPSLAGIYYFDLNLSFAQPEGEYLVFVNEPGAGIKAPIKVTMEQELDVTFNFEDFDVVGRVISTGTLVGKILSQPLIKGIIPGQSPLTGVISSNQVTAKIFSQPIIRGSVECPHE